VPPTPTPAPQYPTSVVIGIQDDVRFSPNRTTIAAGGTVTFSWSGEVIHNVVSATNAFATGTVKAGSFTFTLPSPGTYSYLCEVHPTTMKGIIEVK
jgi:plastocyanin